MRTWKLGSHPRKGTCFCFPELSSAEPPYSTHSHWVMLDKALLFSSVKYHANNSTYFKSVFERLVIEYW